MVMAMKCLIADNKQYDMNNMRSNEVTNGKITQTLRKKANRNYEEEGEE